MAGLSVDSDDHVGSCRKGAGARRDFSSYLGWFLAAATACGDAPAPSPVDGGLTTFCSSATDPDHDQIPSVVEGTGDRDGDGLPNDRDPDADGDGHPDLEEAGDADCTTAPRDLDGDGQPDFLDTDGNGDGIDDREQSGDYDNDGVADWRDSDLDGDGVRNTEESPDGVPTDFDGDGVPDVLDDDTDGDTIRDADEGVEDIDGDGQPNFRDLDSDGDGLGDRVEAGDAALDTVPVSCAAEVSPTDSSRFSSDGLADFADLDSDNDGAPDGAERRYGSDPCNPNTDGDAYDDVVEVAYSQVNCPDGGRGPVCRCATDPSCGIPESDFFVVLPYRGAAEERTLTFATDIRVADVFFLTDTTGSMDGTISNVKATVGRPRTGLIDRIGNAIPDAWFSGGQHDDFPLGDYGVPRDVAFRRAISSTPPNLPGLPPGTGRLQVADAFDAIEPHGGADRPEAQTEALNQIVTGVGGAFVRSGRIYRIPNYVRDCQDTRWGAACFRSAALPIVVHFTDSCSHQGPPGDTSTCGPYAGITPIPATWEATMANLNQRGVKYIGINASSAVQCRTLVEPDGETACYFLRRTAEETGSVDLEGQPLVYDLPNESESEVFVDTIVDAVETLTTRVPFDVTTALRDDPNDPWGIDATRFVARRAPACSGGEMDDACWRESAGVIHEEAVGAVDRSTFFSVLPGTEVDFDITFENNFHEGGPEVRVFVAFIDISAGGSSVLSTRQVFVVVPARGGQVI